MAEYFCSECGASIFLEITTKLLCENCGSKIFYKARTKKVVHYEAR